MPAGAVHRSMWKSYAPTFLSGYASAELGVSLAWLFIGGEFSRNMWVFSTMVYVWATAFYLIGSFVDPDLDQLGVTQADGRMLRIPVLGYFMFSYWNFYAAMMGLIAKLVGAGGMFGSAHRSWVTHSVFPGTQFRCLFFNLPIYVLLLYTKSHYGLPDFINQNVVVAYLIGQMLGLGQADWLHCIMDTLNPGKG